MSKIKRIFGDKGIEIAIGKLLESELVTTIESKGFLCKKVEIVGEVEDREVKLATHYIFSGILSFLTNIAIMYATCEADVDIATLQGSIIKKDFEKKFKAALESCIEEFKTMEDDRYREIIKRHLTPGATKPKYTKTNYCRRY